MLPPPDPMSNPTITSAQGVGRPPFPGRLLLGQHEAAGARAAKLREARRGELATTPLRIDEVLDRPRQVGRLDRPLAMVRMPRFEKLDDAATVGSSALTRVDPLDRIATTERQERVAAS
jgi:hypothetical protein